MGQAKVGKKYNWWCISWDFPTNLAFFGKGFRALGDLFPCSAAWVTHLPGLATVQSQGGDAGRTLNLLLLTQSLYLTSIALISGHIQVEAAVTFDFFGLKSLIMLDFCWLRFSPHPGFSVSMLWRLEGSPYDVQWCSGGMGQSYCTV